MMLVLVISFWAGSVKLFELYSEGNYLLVFLDAVVLVTSLLVMLEAVSVISRVPAVRSKECGETTS